MDLISAIIWTISLVYGIIAYAIGSTPSWLLVFCPLIVLVFEKWEDYFKNKY